MPMNQNVGMTDRIIRIILAVLFIVLALVHSAWWFIPALVALVTGIVGWCGLYEVFQWSTCPLESKPAKATKTAKPAKKAAKKKK